MMSNNKGPGVNSGYFVSSSPQNPYLRRIDGAAVGSSVRNPATTINYCDSVEQHAAATQRDTNSPGDERCIVVPAENNPYYHKNWSESNSNHTPKKRSLPNSAQGNAPLQRAQIPAKPTFLFAAANMAGTTPQCTTGELYAASTLTNRQLVQDGRLENLRSNESLLARGGGTCVPTAEQESAESFPIDLDRSGDETLVFSTEVQAIALKNNVVSTQLTQSITSRQQITALSSSNGTGTPPIKAVPPGQPTSSENMSAPTASPPVNMDTIDHGNRLALQQEMQEAYDDAIDILNSNGWANIPREDQSTSIESAARASELQTVDSTCASPPYIQNTSSGAQTSAASTQLMSLASGDASFPRIKDKSSPFHEDSPHDEQASWQLRFEEGDGELQSGEEEVIVNQILSPNEILRRRFDDARLNGEVLDADMYEAGSDNARNSHSTDTDLPQSHTPALDAKPNPDDLLVHHTNNNGSDRPSGEPSLEWDPLQLRAIELIDQGRNIFLTGVAGTGKSEVTKEIVRRAYRKFSLGEVAVGAPTGVAAVNLSSRSGVQRDNGENRSDHFSINATTIHKIFGIAVPSKVREFGNIWSKHQVDSHEAGTNEPLPSSSRERLRKLKLLVIDEVGMIQAEFLDWLDVFVRDVRGRHTEAFGGIQLVFIGDFAQLGPVPGRHVVLQYDNPMDHSHTGADLPLEIRECSAMIFQSAAWREANFYCIELKRIFRQQHDRGFAKALMDIRVGHTQTPEVQNLVQQCRRPLEDRINIPADIVPTKLYSCNFMVDDENRVNLDKLACALRIFKANDDVRVECDEYRDPSLSIEEARDLLWNDDFFGKDSRLPSVLYLKEKAQVMLLANKSNELVNGSRGVIVRYEPSDEIFPGYDASELFPVVRFMNGMEERIDPCEFTQDVYRVGTCVRCQIPLKLAWAMTIHKSQGSTLDLVEVDLNNCFAYGQAYVALSRARSANSLCVRNYRRSAVRVNRLVLRFYKVLQHWQNLSNSASPFHGGSGDVSNYSKVKDEVKKELKFEDSIRKEEGAPLTMDDFLSKEAGMWWYPILKYPRWLSLFRFARGNGKAASQFRTWEEKYSPLPGYNGWWGYYKK